MTPEILTSVVLGYKGPSPSGVCCRFIPVDEKWGLKVYHREEKRDECYDRQQRMAEYNLAPQVGISFNVGNKFCYVTERAMPLAEGRTETQSYLDWNKEFTIMNCSDVTIRMREEVYKKMKEKGFEMFDRHACNFGFVNKMMVCIDFGND